MGNTIIRESSRKRFAATIKPKNDSIVPAQAGLAQDVFADKSGLNRAHVGEIEHGRSNVTNQTLKIVADTLKVRLSDLVGSH